ncbi:MAG TPA: 3-deoxy-D-manno-octulosonic acid transferase [Candidatus Gastranaerophilaceae bacterium]|nr:3-deoxy-D-manno-octulosonic acid transferase [Candidatus Gastranaerophilaceae bacterium]
MFDMFFIYGILSTIAFVLILPFWLVLGVFKPKLLVGFKQKCGFYSSPFTLHSSPIVFYGISVGEVLAMENLIRKTKEKFPQKNIVLMTGTQTGQEIAQKKLSEVCSFISYFPYDFPFCINNFLNKINPEAVFIMETELWPNFAYILNKKKIPLFIINARISDGTYKSYKKLSWFFAPILHKYTGIYPQSQKDMEKLISIGANPDKTKVMGNLKFDIKKPDTKDLNFNKNPNNKILLAGSTHSGEDEIILDVFGDLKKEISGLKLIIAPRHPERIESVLNLMQKKGKTARRSLEWKFSDEDMLLIDTMGELSKFYSICDVAFLGGSFNKTGGHNPLEAIIFEKPVISGSNIRNFKDIYTILTSTSAGKVVQNKQELKNELKKLFTDEDYYKKASQDCKKVFEQNQGALDFVINVIQTLV